MKNFLVLTYTTNYYIDVIKKHVKRIRGLEVNEMIELMRNRRQRRAIKRTLAKQKTS